MRLAATLSGDSFRAGRGPDWCAAIAQIPRVHSKGGHNAAVGEGAATAPRAWVTGPALQICVTHDSRSCSKSGWRRVPMLPMQARASRTFRGKPHKEDVLLKQAKCPHDLPENSGVCLVPLQKGCRLLSLPQQSWIGHRAMIPAQSLLTKSLPRVTARTAGRQPGSRKTSRSAVSLQQQHCHGCTFKHQCPWFLCSAALTVPVAGCPAAT